jgi:hypothetical protein
LAVVEFVKPTGEMLRVVADTMRQADVDEVAASHGHTPLQALQVGVDVSDFIVAVVIDGDPVAIMGLSKCNPITGTGVPWLLSSENELKYKREFLLQSPKVIEQMLNICPNLFNFVHAENKTSVRWLKWLGFTIEEPKPLGVKKEMFHRFHMKKAD